MNSGVAQMSEAVIGVRTINMVPAAQIDGLAELHHDPLGRETFGFFLTCEHGQMTTLICSDARTVREVADQLGKIAIDSCLHCFASAVPAVTS